MAQSLGKSLLRMYLREVSKLPPNFHLRSFQPNPSIVYFPPSMTNEYLGRRIHFRQLFPYCTDDIDNHFFTKLKALDDKDFLKEAVKQCIRSGSAANVTTEHFSGLGVLASQRLAHARSSRSMGPEKIMIDVQTEYLEDLPQFSQTKTEGLYRFRYSVFIHNGSNKIVQLISRYWNFQPTLHSQIVGDGVLGKMPVLMPGEAILYSSYVPLQSSQGSMAGNFLMRYFDDTVDDMEDQSIGLGVPACVLKDGNAAFDFFLDGEYTINGNADSEQIFHHQGENYDQSKYFCVPVGPTSLSS
jgi:ApaG protein